MSDIRKLEARANQARQYIVQMIHEAGSGHPGGSLSCTDILTCIYENEVDFSKENRDQVVLSKGHAAPALYAQLCVSGVFDPEEFHTFRKLGTRLQGHPNMNDLPGVDMSTGSLGQGISTAAGLALGDKYQGIDRKVWCICGDGEFQEGQVYEALECAVAYGLNNLIVILDLNRLQITGDVANVCDPDLYAGKLKAFGFDVIELDGHDMSQILDAMEKAKKADKPTALVCHTINGKGVSFMENEAGWHGTAPNDAQFEQAMKELEVKA